MLLEVDCLALELFLWSTDPYNYQQKKRRKKYLISLFIGNQLTEVLTNRNSYFFNLNIKKLKKIDQNLNISKKLVIKNIIYNKIFIKHGRC